MLTSQLGIQWKLSTAYHPQTDSQTEWVNQCVEQYLRNFCSYQQDDWVDWLGVAEFHYNHLIHDSTRISPFYANYGFNPSFSIPHLHQSLTPATSDFLSHLSIIRSELMAKLKLVQESAKLKYDTHRAVAPTFDMGDLVMLSCWNIKTTWPSDKFDYRKLGPFKVVNQVGNNAYQLELTEMLSRLHPVFNINLLEPYTPPSSFPNHLHQTGPVPEVVLEGGNILKLKDVLDVRKIGCQFDYLVEFLDKPISDWSWIPLTNIPSNYDEILEWFHHRHTAHPKPSPNAFKAKVRTPIHDPTLSTSLPSIPSTSILPSHDPLAHVPQPITLPDPDQFMYRPPSLTTTWSKRKLCPRNLDHITESITSNMPQRSSAS